MSTNQPHLYQKYLHKSIIILIDILTSEKAVTQFGTEQTKFCIEIQQSLAFNKVI